MVDWIKDVCALKIAKLSEKLTSFILFSIKVVNFSLSKEFSRSENRASSMGLNGLISSVLLSEFSTSLMATELVAEVVLRLALLALVLNMLFSKSSFLLVFLLRNFSKGKSRVISESPLR